MQGLLYLSVAFIMLNSFCIVQCDYPDVKEKSYAEFMGNDTIFGRIAAFGDINSDKQTDVFVISDDGAVVYVLAGSLNPPPALTLFCELKLDHAATSIVPSDFNGDNTVDLLVTYKSGNDLDSYGISIYWGKDEKFNASNVHRLSDLFYDEPLVLDANGDMIADLFVVYQNQTRGFLVGQKELGNWTFIPKNFELGMNATLNDTFSPHSHAFVDLTGEGSANLFVTAANKDKKLLNYEVWEGSSSGLVLHSSIRIEDSEFFSDSDLQIGHAAFADFTGNAQEDIAVATCVKDGDSCKNGQILIFTDSDWSILYTLNDEWTFPDSKDFSQSDNTLHIADFNLDSYPDVMTIIQNKDGIRKTVIFYNEPCKSDYCKLVGRQLGTTLTLPNSDHAVLAAFYDFSMDGTIDVIVTTKSTTSEHFVLKAYDNMIADDVTFLRVQVLSGNTETALFGVNIPGPQITYETTNTEGGPQRGCLGQLSQSAHFSLQLPYVVFGLGRLANFVESLRVSIPVSLIADVTSPIMTQINDKDSAPSGSSDVTFPAVNFKPLNNSWPMLIPNSQLYVIPYPKHSPKSWKNQLLVTPGNNVIMTGVVLISTMGLLAVVTVILHWLERREDKQEKIQEAIRFHFDAM